MRPRTEALLTLRDGEPIDAEWRAEVLAESDAVAELERLRRMKAALCDLPDVAPPDGVWERVAAELDADDTRQIRPPLRWAAGVAIAATAAVAAIVYLGQSPQTSPGPTTTVAEGARNEPWSTPIMPPSYVALVEESARLERLLAEIPYQRPMMTARTARTIVGLEDRIAYVDEQLTFGTAYDMQIPAREALWGERVELMNALVHVRYAQAQRTGF